MLIFAQCTRIFLAYEMRNKCQQQRLWLINTLEQNEKKNYQPHEALINELNIELRCIHDYFDCLLCIH